MKYAIIVETKAGNKYLKGFTNIFFDETNTITGQQTYTVKLKKLDSLWIPLEGDAAIYLGK